MSTQRSREEWQSLLAISFITLAIVSLVLVPLIGQRYVRPLHHEMKLLAEPGRGWVTQMHVALALQGAALRDYVETRLPGSAARFRDAADAQIVASDNLSLLAEKLGPEVQRRFADVRNLERRWHETAEAVVSAPLPEAGAMSSSQDLFESLLLASGRLDEAIDAASQTRRVRIEAAERTLRTVTMMLGFVALAAVVAVIALGRRVRQGALLAEQRRANLQEAVESRARLIRGISHDLKNPLNAIDGHAQLLLADMRGQLCEGQRDSIERIRAAASSLIALVDDLLRLSIAESGQLRLHNREVDVANLVTEVCEGLRPGALAARHELSVSIASGVSPIRTDGHRVKQILENLLANAIKYTPPGGQIEMRVDHGVTAIGPDKPVRRHVSIAVLDTGPGIPHDQMEAVFEEFRRIEVGPARAGTGLGLAIARSVAALLDGTLTVSNRKEGGAEFTLLLPAEATSPSSFPAERAIESGR